MNVKHGLLRRLRLFENRILRRIFGCKRDVNGEWRRHHNELHSLNRSPNILRGIKSRWAGDIARMEEVKFMANIFKYDIL